MYNQTSQRCAANVIAHLCVRPLVPKRLIPKQAPRRRQIITPRRNRRIKNQLHRPRLTRPISLIPLWPIQLIVRPHRIRVPRQNKTQQILLHLDRGSLVHGPARSKSIRAAVPVVALVGTVGRGVEVDARVPGIVLQGVG